jgi:hypothetical protein
MGRPKTEAATYKSLMLRLPTDMLEACKERATEKRRSLNAQLLWVIDEWLHETTEKKVYALTSADKD